MKRLLAIVSALSLAASVNAANLDKGTYEAQLGGGIDFDTAADTRFDLDIGVGYFFADFIEAGVQLALSDDDAQSSYGAGVFGEYNFDLGSQFVPYVGASVSWFNVDVETPLVDESEDAGVIGAFGGGKFFITDDVAIFTELAFDWASEDIYPEDDGDVEDTEWTIAWGLRYFFDL